MHNRLVLDIINRSDYRRGNISERTGTFRRAVALIKNAFRLAYYAWNTLVQAERIIKSEGIGRKEQLIAYSRNGVGSTSKWLDKYFGEGTKLSEGVIVEISANSAMCLLESDHKKQNLKLCCHRHRI